ncbi:MAG: hypothetical protein AAFZ35_24430, partial [Cyanobacteria bacterium J06649_12]
MPNSLPVEQSHLCGLLVTGAVFMAYVCDLYSDSKEGSLSAFFERLKNNKLAFNQQLLCCPNICF